MDKKHNLYDVLNIKSDSSPDEIKKAYKKLALIYHPDKYGDGKDDFKFKEINDAYKILMDQKTRKKYDDALKENDGGNVLVSILGAVILNKIKRDKEISDLMSFIYQDDVAMSTDIRGCEFNKIIDKIVHRTQNIIGVHDE